MLSTKQLLDAKKKTNYWANQKEKKKIKYVDAGGRLNRPAYEQPSDGAALQQLSPTNDVWWPRATICVRLSPESSQPATGALRALSGSAATARDSV